MNLTKRTVSAIVALALVFTTLVFVSVGAAGVLPVHDTIVTYSGGSIQNAKGTTPSYISEGKIGYFSVQDMGYDDKTSTLMSAKATSNASNLYNFVDEAYNSSKTINIDLYAEFDSTLDKDRVAAAIDFGPGWVTTLKKNTNVTEPTKNEVVDFVNGEKVTLKLSANDVLRDDKANLDSAVLKKFILQINPEKNEKITGTFYYTAPYLEGSQAISTVNVTKVPVTTNPSEGTNDGVIDIYNSPCKITGYDKSAYSNSKFLLGDIGGENEGRFAYIKNSDEESGNQQIQSRLLFSGFDELVAQAQAQNKSICMDIYTNDFDYKEHKTNGGSAGENSFCYLVYAFDGGCNFDANGDKDIRFTRKLKKTLVFTPGLTGTDPQGMRFQFQNYDYSGYTLSNFEFIVSAPYLEGSTPVDSSFKPSTTATTTTFAPATDAYEGGEIAIYDNGVTYTGKEAWNNSCSVTVGDNENAKGKYAHIDSVGTPQQMQGKLNIEGLSNLRKRAVESGKSIFIDVYTNDFSNGKYTPGKCDMRIHAGGSDYYPPQENKFTLTAKYKKTFIIPTSEISETASSYSFNIMNYSYGDYATIKNAKFIVSVPYILGDEEKATKITPSTTTTTTTTTTTQGVSHIVDGDLPITAPTSDATYTGGWGNPSNGTLAADGKISYITYVANNQRVQLCNNASNFGKVILEAIKKNKRIAIDFYGEFIEYGKSQDNSTARIKMALDTSGKLWYGNKEDSAINGNDESNSAPLIKIKNGEVTTQYYDPQKILDAYRNTTTTTKAVASDVYEVEKITSTGTANHIDFTQTDIEPKNAKMHKFDDTAVGEYVEYTIPSQKAGTYNLSVSSRDYSDRGIFDVYANGVKIANNVRFTSSGANATYVNHALGSYTLESDGNIVIKFVCKKVGSGTTSMILDSISCKDANSSSSSSSSSAGLTDEDIAKNINGTWVHILGGSQNGYTRGRVYMTVPYIEGDNDGNTKFTVTQTTTTKPTYSQPEREDGEMPAGGWDMSKINLDYIDCRISSVEWRHDEANSSAKVDASKKFFTITRTQSGPARIAGAQFNINGGRITKPFSEYLEYAKSVCETGGMLAFDIFPDFTVSDGNNYAYLQADFGSLQWPTSDKAYRIQSGKRYTFYVDPSDIPDDLSKIQLRIMNYTYGNGMENYTFHITAPYIVGANPDVTTTTTTTSATTKKTQEGTYQYPSNNADGETKFYVSNTKVKAGGTVKVPVKIYKNAGLFSAKFSVKYKTDTLSLAGVENGDVFDSIDVSDETDVINIFAYQKNGNTSADGVVCYLVFDAETESTNSPIIFAGSGYSPSNFFNFDGVEVGCSFKGGHVIIGDGGPASEIEPDPGTYIPYPTSNSGSTKLSINTITDEYNVNNKDKQQTMYVSISGNAGLNSVKFGIRYNEKQLEYVKDTAKFVDTIPVIFNKDYYNLSIDDSDAGFIIVSVTPKSSVKAPSDSKINGKLIQFNFKVKDYKVGEFLVTFGGFDYNSSNFTNLDGKEVPCSFTSGAIKLVDTSNNNNSSNNATSVGSTSLTGIKLTGKKAANIAWRAASNATGYEIYRAVGSSNSFNLIGRTSGTSYTDSKLAAGKKYTYKVKAVNSSSSSWSNVLSISTMNYKTKAKIKSAKSSKKKTLKVSIKKKVFGAKGYQIQYATNKKFKKAKKTTTTSTKKTIKKLASKKTYYVRVRSYNIVNGKKAYGKWSTAKISKVK